MLDLDKLNKMLDSVLDSETSESLNNWIDEQIAADRAQGMQSGYPTVVLPSINFVEFAKNAQKV